LKRLDKLKQGLRGAFLDEDRVFEKVTRNVAFRPLSKFSLAMTVSSILLAVMLIGMLLTRPTIAVAGVVSVDLNPSVRFELTDEYVVLKALSQNAQADSLDMKSLVGLRISDAIAALVKQTIEKGYIDRLSLTQDFILVTTVATDGQNTTFSVDLKSLLSNLQKENPLLSGMSIAFMEALREDLENADAQNEPFWLYLLQKENPDLALDKNATVQSYFEDPVLRSEFETSLGEVDDDDDFDDDDLLEALDYLQKQGVDVSTYRDRLNQPDVSIEQLAKEIKEVLEDEEQDEEDSEDKENESEEDENDDEHDEEDD
jgi:hypothetical protein